MDVGDLIQITDEQTLTGYVNPIYNVYTYEVISLTASVDLPVYADDIAEAFLTTVLDYVCAIQSTSITHTKLSFWNLTHQLEIATHEWEVPPQGQVAGEFDPAHLSFSFRLNRYNRLTRNGRKSIAGVPESATTGGRNVSVAFSTIIPAAGVAIGSTIFVEGGTTDATLLPVIVRMPANPGVPPVTWNPVTSAVFRGFGTQNSRKAL